MSAVAPLAWLPLLAIGVIVAKRMTSWPRAFGAARSAAVVLGAAWAGLRLFDFLARGGGPMSWAFVGEHGTTQPIVATTFRIAVGAGGVLAVATIVIARVRTRGAEAVAFGGVAAGIFAACAALVAGTFAAAPLVFATALPIDVAAVMPAIAAALAVGFLVPRARAREAATVVSLMPRDEASGETVGEVRGDPTFTAPAAGSVAVAGNSDEIDRVWDACGGAGAAPGALRAALAAGDDGVVIGDLPAPTEDALVDALALVTMFDARRALVIAADAEDTRDRILGRARVLGGWRAGVAVAGEGELAAAMAAGQAPVLVVLSTRDLAGKSLGVPGWVGLVDRVILVGVDQLAPIASTHAAFALRRLRLALDRERVRASWIATSASGDAAPFLERATRARFAMVPLGAAWTARTSIYVRSDGGSADDSTPYRNEVACIEDRQLAALYRARTQLAHRMPGNAHTGLWSMEATPLATFLLREGVLASLAQQGELPAARPVVGLANRFLAAAHLEAALAEGAPDMAALRWAFGDTAVAELVATRPEVRTGARRASWNAEAHAVAASPALALGAWTDPRRDTVTANAVEVKSAIDGAVIARVDRRTAATRMYPHRVFRARGTLWRLAPDAITARPTTDAPTSPALAVALGNATWATRPEQHAAGKQVFARGVVTIAVDEQVTGSAHGPSVHIAVDEPVPGTASVYYAPVTSAYTTSAVVVMFESAPLTALRHAGRLAAALVPALVRVERDDFEILFAPEGIGGVARPALVIVDRHVDGLGLADALDARTLRDLLRWTWGILYRCPCVDGCAACTPADVLAAGSDKLGALRLLGG